MKAVIADIHSNLEALVAVLEDAAAHHVSEIYCLGDIVGYGPNPNECIDLVANCSIAVLGNHDLAALGGPTPPTAESQFATLWTRRELASGPADQGDSRRRRHFLASLPLTHREGEFLFLHGSPRDPLNEYVFPEDVYKRSKMESLFASVDRVCFMGHTHVPGIITDDLAYTSPSSTNDLWKLDGRKTLCNVGSVGQPRDGDPRACYALLDGDMIRFRRIDYDFEATARKVADMPDMPPQ